MSRLPLFLLLRKKSSSGSGHTLDLRRALSGSYKMRGGVEWAVWALGATEPRNARAVDCNHSRNYLFQNAIRL